MQLRTILVPTDFSHSSQQALSWALELVTRWGSRVVLLHALPPWDDPVRMKEAGVSIADFEAGLRADAEAQAQELLSKTDQQGVTIQTCILVGLPNTTICHVAEQEQADLIIMGSHGRTGLAHVFLGSVAENTVRYAPCPVLVIRPDRSEQPA
jgi:universal stress protein A